MNVYHAIVLGIVQGLSEFLPISSSAHLLLVPYFFKWHDPGLSFDVALHWGTLLAVLAVFWKDYWRYAGAFFATLYTKDSWKNADSKLAWFLIIACIPGALFGMLFDKQIETIFRSPLITVFTLAGFGFILWLADKKAVHKEKLDGLTWLKALGIGLSQAVALVPGVSRSGATITAALLCKLDRQAAVRFSFLLSGPIVFGAGLVALRHASFDAAFLWGFLAAAISGFAAIKFLLKYVTTHSFNMFVWYRYLLAATVLLLIIFKF